ncbi:zinc dependent phospholipase C family protein [Planctomycetota bacterium]
MEEIQSKWDRGGDAPLNFKDESISNAFRTGAIAPDAGYMSLRCRWLSDLAHYVSTADLMRCLLQSASSDIELAFALGWASHVVGDAIIHPLINRLVGRIVCDADLEVPYAEDPSSHIRVELGLDLSVRKGNSALIPSCRNIPQETSALLSKAINKTYRLNVAPAQVARILSKACTRFKFMVNAYDGIEAPKKIRDLFTLAVYYVVRVGSEITRKSLPYAVTHPILPTSDALQEFTQIRQRMTTVFFAEYASGFSTFPNKNLDTGKAEDQPYRPTKACLDWLATASDSEAPFRAM